MIYEKLCIICNNEFVTERSNTLYCSKRCRNRVRYLPQQIVNSLTVRNAQFTRRANNYTRTVQNQTRLESNPLDIDRLIASAKELAMKRGIKVDNQKMQETADYLKHGIIADNLKYINKEDPAMGNADGFDRKSEDVQSNTQEVQHDSNSDFNQSSSSVSSNNDSGNGASNKESKTDGTGGLAPISNNGQQFKGLRRLGGVIK